MISIAFPDMLSNTTTNLAYDYDATLQNLKTLLLSSKGELWGDPYFGTNIKKFMFDQNDLVLVDLVIDDIYNAIATFMPQLFVERKNIDIVQSHGKMYITISAINRRNFQTDLYSIELLKTKA